MCNVIVVEDDLDCQQTLAEILGSEGHDVHSFSTIEDAMTGLQDIKLDVAILDFRTPKGDCCSIVGALASKSVSVLVYTAHLSDELHVALLKCGAMWVLAKPTPLKAIAEYVKKACRVANSIRMAKRMGGVSKELRENLRKSTEALAGVTGRIPLEPAASA